MVDKYFIRLFVAFMPVTEPNVASDSEQVQSSVPEPDASSNPASTKQEGPPEAGNTGTNSYYGSHSDITLFFYCL